jgi:hypothetical protein
MPGQLKSAAKRTGINCHIMKTCLENLIYQSLKMLTFFGQQKRSRIYLTADPV